MAGKKSFSGVGKARDQFYERLGKMSKVQRIASCAVIVALVLGSWYFVVFSPKRSELVRLKNKYETESKRLEGYKIKAQAYKKWQRKMDRAQDSFNAATNALPDKRELPALLKGISLAGSRAGLSFLLFQPDPEVDREFYKEIPISLKVQGKYHQMAEFFLQVAQLNRIVSIGNLTMSRMKDDPDVIEMNCRAVTYMFSETPPPEPPKKKGKKNKKKKKG